MLRASFAETEGSARAGYLALRAVNYLQPYSLTSPGPARDEFRSSSVGFVGSSDHLKVVSTTGLAAGTSVQINFGGIVGIVGSFVWPGSNNEYAAFYNSTISWNARVWASDSNGSYISELAVLGGRANNRSDIDGSASVIGTITGSTQFSSFVGQWLALDVDLRVDQTVYSRAINPSFINPYTDARVSARNEYLYLRPVGDNFTLVADSGYSYALPVPEPG